MKHQLLSVHGSGKTQTYMLTFNNHVTNTVLCICWILLFCWSQVQFHPKSDICIKHYVPFKHNVCVHVIDINTFFVLYAWRTYRALMFLKFYSY